MDLKYSMFCCCTHCQSVQVNLMSNPIRRWPSLVHPLIVRCWNSSVQPTARSNVQTALTGEPRREGRWGVSEMCKFLRVGPPLLLLSGYLGGRQRILSVRGTGRRPSLTEDEFHPLGRCCGALLPQWVTGPAVGTGGCIGQGGTGFEEGEGDLSSSEKRTWGCFERGVKRVGLCEELNQFRLIFAISCDTGLQKRRPRLSIYTIRHGILGLVL